jgi:hypothetical protein
MPSHPISLWSISVLSSHLLLGLGVVSFLQQFKDKTSLLVLTNHNYINQSHRAPVLSFHSGPHVSALHVTSIRNFINFDTRQIIYFMGTRSHGHEISPFRLKVYYRSAKPLKCVSDMKERQPAAACRRIGLCRPAAEFTEGLMMARSYSRNM